MIVYYSPYKDYPEITVPILHRVTFNAKHDLRTIEVWCKENCAASYYGPPGWYPHKIMEFEDDMDATRFALLFA